MNAEEYASIAVIIIMPIISYLYGETLRRGGDCRFIFGSLTSMLPLSLFFINQFAALAVMPLTLAVLYTGQCSAWLKAIGIIVGEILMGIIYLEAIFGGLPKLLIIVPQIQLGFFYANNMAMNIIGVASESVNSLLFPLMYLLTVVTLLNHRKAKEWKITIIGLFFMLLINAGTWVDLPTLPLISPTLPLISALSGKAAGVTIGYLITYMRTATTIINYLSSVIAATLLSWRSGEGEFNNGDSALLIMIPLSALANFIYSAYLSMLFFFLFGTLMTTLVLGGLLSGLGNHKIRMNRWILSILYASSFLLFAMSTIETINPSLSMETIMLQALSSPLFSMPTIISMLPFLRSRRQ